ncbi:MAG: helix-turn-helix transcriptional regulator [Shimia sp.]
MTDPLVTAQEFMVALSRSKSAFYQDLKAGRLPPPRYLGGSPRWRQSEIDAVIEALPRSPSA